MFGKTMRIVLRDQPDHLRVFVGRPELDGPWWLHLPKPKRRKKAKRK